MRSACLLLACLAATSSARPFVPEASAQYKVYRRTKRQHDDPLAFAKAQGDLIKLRYGTIESSAEQREAKRASATTEVLSNLNADSQYFGTISVGTPTQNFYIVMDTGSADFWVAGPSCDGCPSGIQTYTSSQSTSAVTGDQSFDVTYGSGEAVGTLVEDVVTMAGYKVASQAFATVNATSGSLLTSPVSGLMGFGFKSIASSRQTPFWQNAGITQFGFALTRFQNDASADDVEPGGIMTVNGVNSSLYTGSINYVPLISSSFWLITLGGIAVDGRNVSTASQSTAIDTGTTLIGGPSTTVSALYAAISGSKAQTGRYEGYYTFPCSSTFTVTLEFGGIAYAIDQEDFNLGPIDSKDCLGAVFAVDTTAGGPAWIAGDAFMKSYYTTFRASPAAVGFASLSSVGKSLADAGAEATLSAAAVNAVSSTMAQKSAADPALRIPRLAYSVLASFIWLSIVLW